MRLHVCFSCHQAQAAGNSLAHTFLDVLLEVGQYTALVEVIFGHEDHFGSTAGQLIENKLALIRGPVTTNLRLSTLPTYGAVPPGALAIPRYKVWTIVGAMQDVELHELHGVFHAGRGWKRPLESATSAEPPVVSQSKRAKKRRVARAEESAESAVAIRRTCWRRTADDADGEHFAEGVGIADWLSRLY